MQVHLQGGDGWQEGCLHRRSSLENDRHHQPQSGHIVAKLIWFGPAMKQRHEYILQMYPILLIGLAGHNIVFGKAYIILRFFSSASDGVRAAEMV